MVAQGVLVILLTQNLIHSGHFVLGASRSLPAIHHDLYNHKTVDISSSHQYVDFLNSIDLENFDNIIVVAGTNNVKPLHDLSLRDLDYLMSVNFVPSF